MLVVVHRLTGLNGRRTSTMMTMNSTGWDLTVRLVEAIKVTVVVGNVRYRSI